MKPSNTQVTISSFPLITIGPYSRCDVDAAAKLSRTHNSARFSVRPDGLVWSHPHFGRDHTTRRYLNGQSDLLDDAALALLAIKPAGGRIWIEGRSVLAHLPGTYQRIRIAKIAKRRKRRH